MVRFICFYFFLFRGSTSVSPIATPGVPCSNPHPYPHPPRSVRQSGLNKSPAGTEDTRAQHGARLGPFEIAQGAFIYHFRLVCRCGPVQHAADMSAGLEDAGERVHSSFLYEQEWGCCPRYGKDNAIDVCDQSIFVSYRFTGLAVKRRHTECDMRHSTASHRAAFRPPRFPARYAPFRPQSREDKTGRGQAI